MTSKPQEEAVERGLEFHRSRQLDQALFWYQAALAVDPDDSQVNSLIGLALVHAGRGQEGIPYLRRAVELEPGQMPFRFNLVQGLRAVGAYGPALAELGTVLVREPRNVRAWERAGDVAQQQRDDDGAAKAWARACEIDPKAIRPALKLASLHNSRRRFDAALAALNPIADRAADNETIYELWCEALVGLRDWNALRATAASWAGGRPGSPAAWRNVARAEFELGRHRAAVDAFGKVMAPGEPSAADLAAFGGLCLHALDYRAAEAALKRAETMEPSWPETLANLALLSMYRGRFAESEAYCRRALAVNPEHVAAYSVLSRLRRGKLADTELQIVSGLADRQDLALDHRIPAAFTKAHALDARGDIEAAMAAYDLAHQLALARDELEGRSYDRAAEDAREQRLIDLFSRPAPSSPVATPGTRPIFIIGMPRSGTTLIEAVLGAHSRVHAAGERTAMRSLLHAYLELDAAGSVPASRLLAGWASSYLDGLTLPSGADHITDKQPLNFEAVGLILRLFPHAVIVGLRRDPIETGLSIYRQEFNKLWTFAHRLEDIGHAYRRHERLVAHWENIFPGRILTVRYEEFASDFPQAAPRLVRACGLEWEEGCLEFQRSPGPISTFSTVQVRDPVANLNGRAARYAAYLGPLTASLATHNRPTRT